MNRLPPLELLEATHQFPGPYTFKVIGSADPTFVPRLVAAVREELHYERDPAYETRESAGGRHVAVTFDLVLRAPADVHTVYNRLVAEPGVLVML